jgi:hypothetical protein
VHWLVIDRDNPGFEIDGQLACPDRRFRVALRRANDFELGQATPPWRNKRSTNVQRFS